MILNRPDRRPMRNSNSHLRLNAWIIPCLVLVKVDIMILDQFNRVNCLVNQSSRKKLNHLGVAYSDHHCWETVLIGLVYAYFDNRDQVMLENAKANSSFDALLWLAKFE